MPMKDEAFLRLQAENAALKERLEQAEGETRMLESELSMIRGSHAYAAAKKLENVFLRLLPVGSARYRLVRRAWKCGKRFFNISGERSSLADTEKFRRLKKYGAYPRMDVVATRHTLYVAELVRNALERVGIACTVLIGEPRKYQEIPYLIICPQFVRRFPQVYFTFQMEQTVSSRWFTKSYAQALAGSCGILDYAMENLAYYDRPSNRELSSLAYYVPVDYHTGMQTAREEKVYDVLFYGDTHCQRRKEILEAIGRKFHLKICSEVYGEDVYREIRKAKVVVNLHYYEHALLETTRLYETLSLNCAVIVSEDSNTCEEAKRLWDVVDFVPTGDVEALLERLAWWVEHDAQREEKVKETNCMLQNRSSAFDFFFYRFLLAHDRITYDTFDKLTAGFLQLPGVRLCLNLPESVQRRRAFNEANTYGFHFVPGLRHIQGWVGCALSYKMIFQKAMEQRLEELTVCEDDVLFPENFEQELMLIKEWLNRNADWELFSGVMADADGIKVLNSEKQGETYMLRVNRMISTVFNVVHKRAFSVLAAWNPSNRNAQDNAIDRYLEQQHLAVYTRVPFLVGHREEMNSTIWGVSNRQYVPMIVQSEQQLRAQAEECL